ncbi:MAG: GPW/gp25 family protein [Ghiorsea sp.]
MGYLAKSFTDLNINMAIHPLSGEYPKVYDDKAVGQSIRNIVMTNHYENPFIPWFGANLVNQLFELPNISVERTIEMMIHNSLTQFEPRAQIISIVVLYSSMFNQYDVTIKYTVIGKPLSQQVDLVLARAR